MKDTGRDNINIVRALVYASGAEESRTIDSRKVEWHDGPNQEERTHMNEIRNLLAHFQWQHPENMAGAKLKLLLKPRWPSPRA